MRKIILLVGLFLIALALGGYFAFNRETPSTFKGPNGEPSVNGPSGLPSGSRNY